MSKFGLQNQIYLYSLETKDFYTDKENELNELYFEQLILKKQYKEESTKLSIKIKKLDKNDALKRIFKQVYMPKEPMAVVNTMQLIDRLLSSCQLWIIHCNMDENAGEIAYKTIFAE